MRILVIAAIAMLAGPASAQLSVTTFGATEAQACYHAATNAISNDTADCDAALKKGGLTRKDKASTYVNRGIILNRLGDLQAALDDFNAALKIKDSLAEAWLNRGNTWFLAGDYDAALSDYRKALDLGVSEPWAAWYNIGLVHDARKETELAQDAYRTALDLNPDFALARNKLKG